MIVKIFKHCFFGEFSSYKEGNKGRFFSIIADEVNCCSFKEQVSLVLRYVDGRGKIIERFVNFIHCDEGIKGKAVSNKIISCIVNELGLDLSDCSGQCYDGAANIRDAGAHFRVGGGGSRRGVNS